jgi:hypothetical protein
MFSQSASALHSLKSLAFQRIPITLASTYKGLLFDEKIEPLKVGPEQVIFSAPRQHVCMTLRDPIYLHSRALPESIRASLQALDTSACEIVLVNFRFSGNPWRDRFEQRVQPLLSIPAMITIDQRIVQASLTDLSLHGAGVSINFVNGQKIDPVVKSSIDINFQLDSQTRLSMRSTVAFTKKVGSSVLNLGLRLFPTPNQEICIGEFIARRKVEIMGELQQELRDRMESARIVNKLI